MALGSVAGRGSVARALGSVAGRSRVFLEHRTAEIGGCERDDYAWRPVTRSSVWRLCCGLRTRPQLAVCITLADARSRTATIAAMPHDADPAEFLARFAWHPEPELIGVRDERAARPALERLGRDAWDAALDYVYGEAMRRTIGEPVGYAELRRDYFGPAGRAGPAPSAPSTSADLLAEFRTRIAPHQLNAWHPRTLSYFTPPPLPMSIVGELLAQVTNQGVDVWHAGPVAAFVEEEVVRWLCDLVGYGPESFGLLTSGGTMANFVGLALARDVHLARLRGTERPPRGAALEGVRVYASDQTHFSVARALDEMGFLPRRSSPCPRTTNSDSTARPSTRRSCAIVPPGSRRWPSSP